MQQEDSVAVEKERRVIASSLASVRKGLAKRKYQTARTHICFQNVAAEDNGEVIAVVLFATDGSSSLYKQPLGWLLV